MNKIPERRKHIRIEKPYLIRFRVQPCDNNVSEDWDTVAVANLSAGGLFFYSSINQEVATILDLEIGFSHYFPPVKCDGKVIRTKRCPDATKTGYAIEFTEISELMKVMISKSLDIAEWQ